MKLTEDPIFSEAILDGVLDRMLKRYDNRERWVKGEDPHLSELLYCLTKSYWQSRDKDNSITFTKKTRLMFALGVALEDVMLRPLGKSVTGTFEGIQFELDAEVAREGSTDLVEYKSTRMGIKRFTEGFPIGYYRQLLGYMKMKGVLKAKFVVMFIIPADLVTWEVEVTEEEIERNWKWITDRRDLRNRFVETGEIPQPFTFNEAYECNDCTFKLLCDIEAAKE